VNQLHFPGLSVKATRCDPAGINTATCETFCRCDDGSDYAIKRQFPFPLTPHNEWFCTHVGEKAGLASPPCRIVDVNGEMCFGSRWETGNEHVDWWVRARAGEIDFNHLAPTISRIFAFDLFVHNTDRHMTNYIVREQRLGHSVLSYDYSEAWLHHGWPIPDLPMPPDCNTIKNMRYLRQTFGDFIQKLDVEAILNGVRAINDLQIVKLIGDHPPAWLPSEKKIQIVRWWNGPEMSARLNNIEKGISDGSYF